MQTTHAISDTSEEALKFAHLLHLANQKFNNLLDRQLSPFDLTASQFNVLDLLVRHRVSSQSQISQHLNVDTSAVTRMLDRLENKGLILRVHDVEDRRKVAIELSAKGQELHQRSRSNAAAAHIELCHGVPDAELHTLQRLLCKLFDKA